VPVVDLEQRQAARGQALFQCPNQPPNERRSPFPTVERDQRLRLRDRQMPEPGGWKVRKIGAQDVPRAIHAVQEIGLD
jgi:hypothetical protein